MKAIKVRPAAKKFNSIFREGKVSQHVNGSRKTNVTKPNFDAKKTQKTDFNKTEKPTQVVNVVDVDNNNGLSTVNKDSIPRKDDFGTEKKANPFIPNVTVTQLWQGFKSDTSMHGMKKAGQIHQYKLRGALWVLAILCMSSLLIYTTVDLLRKYYSYVTISNIDVETVSSLSFPSITFCNLSPYMKTRLIPSPMMDHYLLTLSRMTNFVPSVPFDHPGYAELLQSPDETFLTNSSFPVTEMFQVCVNSRNDMEVCSDVLTEKITDLGRCYTYNSYDHIQKHGPLYTSVTGSTLSLALYIKTNQSENVYSDNLSTGIKFVVHDPDEEPDVTNKGFLASPGFSTYASLQMTKHKYLPMPHRAGNGQYCLDTKASGFRNPLKYHPTYSRTGCWLECRYQYVLSQCGCRSLTDFGTVRICTWREYAECYDRKQQHFMNNGTLQKACNCPIPCQYTSYDANIVTGYWPAAIYEPLLGTLGHTDIRTHYMEVKVFFETLSYMKIEHLPAYDIEKIIASLGGQMGIFLGASLLTISELVEFIIMACLVFCKRKIGQRKQTNIDEPPPYDSHI